ncbi:MAG: Na+/H+ antiporter NhaC family protein [Frisingicoccus sp.]|uniref:Na+/H+ antiporter NhaC family protein n=1 Tax=Frisingicoccus sp. TaxID=1918627 RepID=UPI002A825AB5|nr:Na+/H+ antiporter NhaC family protein [Frisingicoccus sp.]MDY4835108.1 Na+/H+ antiporter NhaC family protein [Frisingicoccus sp.]
MDSAMFIGTWWSLVPPLLAIVLALVTKEVYSSLFIGVAFGALLYTGFQPWEAFNAFFSIMKDSMNLNILIFDVLLGMIIVLMAKSGGSAAYGNWAGKHIKSKRSALLATTGLGVLIFVDDYFNCLTVGSVMRPVTDRFKVSRAKLAYIIDATAAPICIIAPVSSWAAAVNSYVPADAGITGFQLFLRTIPYNLYALLTLAMVLYVSISGFDFGLMRKHEINAANGDLFTSGAGEFEQIKQEEGSSRGHVLDLVLPVAVLIVSAIGAMIYTGFLDGATDIITAFAGCNAEISLIFATSVTILFMLVLYLPRKVVTFKGFMDSFVEGFRLMIPAVAILIFAWSLKGVGDALGIAAFVESVVGSNASASVFIPAIMFLVAIFLAFSTGTSWGTFAILVPIVIAMFPGADNIEMMIIAVSAVLAGAVCGDHVSPISDTTVMSSAGAQSNHINHVSTQMQYAMVVAIVCFVGYLIAGIVQIWWLSLGVSLILLLIVLTVMKRWTEAKYGKVAESEKA